jgi:DNA processing protein
VDLEEVAGQTTLVGIVGTRSPSDYGRRWTRRLVTALVEQGVTIVSGLAQGIDTEAHRSCLAAGGRTIAVLGTGVDLVYPWSNRRLYQELLQQGLAVSEYPAGTQPDRVHFPRRNRIIAGLCQATLVIEAPVRSGALITAHLANDYGRDVYALPGSLDNPQSLGCLNLINQGAQMILDEASLLENLGRLPSVSQPQVGKQTLLPLDLSLEQGLILHTLESLCQQLNLEAVSFDAIVQQTELPASHVSSTLLQLELMGLVSQQPGMRYQRS